MIEHFIPLDDFARQCGVCRQTLAKYVYRFPAIEPSAWANGRALFKASDRAYVVGETTFGKALVQSIYRISGSAGLALTTAHYHTPSGRLIQRPWDATFDEYMTYRERDQELARTHPQAELKYTDGGRKVYGVRVRTSTLEEVYVEAVGGETE